MAAQLTRRQGFVVVLRLYARALRALYDGEELEVQAPLRPNAMDEFEFAAKKKAGAT